MTSVKDFINSLPEEDKDTVSKGEQRPFDTAIDPKISAEQGIRVVSDLMVQSGQISESERDKKISDMKEGKEL